MSCPIWKACFHEECCKEQVCFNIPYWVDYWKSRPKIISSPTPPEVVKSKRRKEKKLEIKSKGKKRYRLDREEEKNRKLYGHLPVCMKQVNICDKEDACDLLSRCIATVPRFKDNIELLNALRGPKTIDEVIRILAKYDPEPMRSYYPNFKK